MNSSEEDDRREFLKTCGRFAAVTPPAMTLLLATSLTSDAIARSGAGSAGGNNGKGNGGRDGSPNGKEDKTRCARHRSFRNETKCSPGAAT
ncbi:MULTISPECIES: hypothetical protein [unclassified Bradyrhizobium]|uniref:hypothetical protein n=1 Tax=unclassified Bradyrhizobium TaxID=2631580 RepID=UPI00088EB05C|nr:hypothetical protein [Bradyrhizobium sp. Rc2d]SDJ85176.1 hypothetical protein SAMN05216338_106924 [Bradyrhizobium sp. Rc2d]